MCQRVQQIFLAHNSGPTCPMFKLPILTANNSLVVKRALAKINSNNIACSRHWIGQPQSLDWITIITNRYILFHLMTISNHIMN